MFKVITSSLLALSLAACSGKPTGGIFAEGPHGSETRNGGYGVKKDDKVFSFDLVQRTSHLNPYLSTEVPFALSEEEVEIVRTNLHFVDADLQDTVIRKLSDLRGKLKETGAELQTEYMIQKMDEYTWMYMEGVGCRDVGDEDAPIRDTVQVAYREDQWIRVCDDFSRMDRANQAALLFHEIVYLSLREKSYTTELVGLVFNQDFAKFTNKTRKEFEFIVSKLRDASSLRDHVTPGVMTTTYRVSAVATSGPSAQLEQLIDAKEATVTTTTSEDGTVIHQITIAGMSVSTAATEGVRVELSADNIITIRDGDSFAVITVGAEVNDNKGQTEEDDKGQTEEDDKGQDDKGYQKEWVDRLERAVSDDDTDEVRKILTENKADADFQAALATGLDEVFSHPEPRWKSCLVLLKFGADSKSKHDSSDEGEDVSVLKFALRDRNPGAQDVALWIMKSSKFKLAEHESERDPLLARAIWSDQDESGELLVKAGAIVTGHRFLIDATGSRMRKTVKAMLASDKIDIEEEGPIDECQAIHSAAWLSDAELIRDLLAAGAHPDARCSRGNRETPLIQLLKGSSSEVASDERIAAMDALVQGGANVNISIDYGGTALDYAMDLSLHREAQFLIDTGTDLNLRKRIITPDLSSVTYLGKAIKMKDLAMVDALLKGGADPNLKGERTPTPLGYVKELMSQGPSTKLEKIRARLIAAGAQ